MKPQRFWAVVDEFDHRILPQYVDGFDSGYLRCSRDRSALVAGHHQRVVRVEVRVVEPRKRKARKGAKQCKP